MLLSFGIGDPLCSTFYCPILHVTGWELVESETTLLGRDAARRGMPGPILLYRDSLYYLLVFPDCLGAPESFLTDDLSWSNIYPGFPALYNYAARLVGVPCRCFHYFRGEHFAWFRDFYWGYWDECFKLGLPVFNDDEEYLDTSDDCSKSQWVNYAIAGSFLALGWLGKSIWNRIWGKSCNSVSIMNLNGL
jgi:hypothetical protein